MKTEVLADFVHSLHVGSGIVVDNLTMIPLLAPAASTTALPLDYIVLDDAIASGEFEISEVSEAGSVPELRVVNRGASPVLIVDGEELLGAKQNRVVNLTILVPAHAEMTIPVSCVEAGRWRVRSRAFSSSAHTQFASGRAKRMARVSHSMLHRGEFVSDQAEVWNDIAEKSARLGTASPTSAMEAIYETHAQSLDRFVEACRPLEHQVGVIFDVDGHPVGYDVFDRPSTLQRMLPKLVRGVAVDALDRVRGSRTLSGTADPSAFVTRVATAGHQTSKALGLGVDIRVSAPEVAGAALLVDEHVVHFGGFVL